MLMDTLAVTLLGSAILWDKHLPANDKKIALDSINVKLA